MGIITSGMRVAAVAIGANSMAILTCTAHAQTAPTTLLNVYEQPASAFCQGMPGCRVDFTTVQQNLKVLRVSCLIDVQTTAITALIGDFQLGNASSDQVSYSFGEYLAPLQLLSASGTNQIYIANVETLHVVPAGSRPAVLIVTRLNPPATMAAQCSISGTFTSN
jgi:hypothetical protein